MPVTSPGLDLIPFAYAAYAAVSVALTVWLARILQRNGQVFLDRVFPNDAAFAGSLNQLLVVGFYLVNLGFAAIHLDAGYNTATTARAAIELLSSKLGGLLLVLAAMHFANLWVFNRIRRSGRLVRIEPPIATQASVARAAA